jgi:hypothetical protein
MTRPPQQPTRDAIPPDERDDYDRVVARHQRARSDRPEELRSESDAGPYFGSLLNSPPLAAALAHLGSLVRMRGENERTYSHADRELVDQVLCADWRTACVQRTHIPDALAVGVRIEAIDALRQGREEELTDDERELVAYIRDVVNGTVTDESYAAMERRFGTRGAAEYTIFIGFLQMTIRLHQAFGVPEPSDDAIDEMLRGFREGTRALDDYRARIG